MFLKGPVQSLQYSRLLQVINDLSELRLFHAHIIKTAYQTDTFLFNCLINKYAKCGVAEDAGQVFDKMPQRDVVSWNSMITGYLRCGYAAEALQLFWNLQRDGLKPSQSTFVNLLVACADIEALGYGKQLHAHIVKFGFGVNICVENALVRAYAKCGSIEDAWQVFDKMPERDDISWQSMLAGYVQNGFVEEGLKLARQIVRAAVNVSQFGFSGILSACGGLEFGEQGKQFHAYIYKIGFNKDVSIGNALISMYTKSKRMEDAGQMFDELSSQDVVSWNAMISGYAQNGHADVGVKIFLEMKLAGVKPNQSTIASFVTSCAGITCLEKARQIHAQIKKIVDDLDISAENAILSMYVRCGSIDYAHRMFEKMLDWNLISWNTMIAGFVQYGYDKEALHLLNEMQWERLKDMLKMVMARQA